MKPGKTLSIFQRLLFSFLGVGLAIVLITGWVNFQSQRKFVEANINSQATILLRSQIEFFEKAYSSRIQADLSLIASSPTLDNYLMAQNDELVLFKPYVERLFIHFTKEGRGIYESLRFIDVDGIEKIVTKGSRRIKRYATKENVLDEAFDQRSFSLFDRLKVQPQGTFLFEGPFRYQGKDTFLVGTSKREPDVGLFGGAVIFHCNLSPFLEQLSQVEYQGRSIAWVYGSDNDLLLSSSKNPTVDPRDYLYQQKGSPYVKVLSEGIKLGQIHQELVTIILAVPLEILTKELYAVFRNTLLIAFVTMLFLIPIALILSKQFSTPLESMTFAASRIASGDLSVRVNVKTSGEMRVLVNSFNSMVHDLSKTTTSAENLRREIIERERVEKALRQAQEGLIQSEKLKSVGQLAAGVAHEVKNPLAILLQITDLLSRKLSRSEKDTPFILESMRGAIQRADSVIKGLLDLSRSEELTLELQDINVVTRDALILVKHELDTHHTQVTQELGQDLPRISLDKGKFEQVLINLFTNAIQAMGGGGILAVRTYTERLTDVGGKIGRRISDAFKPGETVVVMTVEDTGPGIPHDILSNIFDPFVTTKRAQKGSGLGLSVTKAIMELHHGMIDIANREEGGVRVTLMFKI